MDGASAQDQARGYPPAVCSSEVAYESDSFARALPDRLQSEFLRCGHGDEPSRVEQVVIGNLTLSVVSFGFPVRSRIESSGGVAAIARIRHAPEGARWGDANLATGQVRSFGPRTRHLGLNPAGLVTSAVIFNSDLLRETADLLGHDVDVDHLVGPLAGSRELDQALDDVDEVLKRPGEASILAVTLLQDNLLAAVAWSARQDRKSPAWSRSFVTSDRIVARCLDFVRSASIWKPTMIDLCGASAMSERRVRSAFLDVTGMAPIQYFRVAALNRARTLLQGTQYASNNVTDVGAELGFQNLGRFAREYRALFGEFPSDTVRA